MKTILILLMTFILSTATAQDIALNRMNYLSMEHDFDSLQNTVIPKFIKESMNDDWYVQYTQIILEENPKFKIEHMDSLEYLVVPSLNIPVHKLSGYGTNIFEWFYKGELALDKGELLVFEHNRLIAKFGVSKNKYSYLGRLTNEDFGQYLRKIKIDLFKEADIYFKVTITDTTASFPISNIIFLTGENISILTNSEIVKEYTNIWPSMFETEEEFNSYVARIVILSINENIP